ncbi:MAG: hypothetical protein CVV57_05955 [Tenericutes bacterium HGW-Tenericutes-2]|jgi:hypothetical protein|nr:MAG: hypothetical protein CVV57_05955 [Tenericutes bacterium HGW-Tenericutes-2]
MKKLLILFVFLLGAIMLSSCNNASDFVFRNKTKQTKAEIQEKMLFYSNHLLSTIDETLSQNMHLNSEYIEEPEEEIPYIYRENLPPQYDYPYNPDIPDPEFIYHSAEALNLYYETLNLCDDFEEDVFCTIEQEEFDLYIKVKLEEDELFIEAYRYDSYSYFNTKYSFVNTEFMYLNLIDEKVYLEVVRDNQQKSGDNEIHDVFYDVYYESGDMFNISVNMKMDADVYYQKFLKSAKSVFLFSNSEEGKGFNYTDSENSIFHSVSYDANGDIRGIYLVYGYHNPQFKFFYFPNNFLEDVQLTWNLFDVAGWDRVVLNEYGHDQIFNGETEVLQDFSTLFEVYPELSTATTYIFMDKENVTQDIIDLSRYGLSFDFITLEKVNSDLFFLHINHVSILEDYGFDEDMSINKQKLLDLFPYFADETIVAELFNKMG